MLEFHPRAVVFFIIAIIGQVVVMGRADTVAGDIAVCGAGFAFFLFFA